MIGQTLSHYHIIDHMTQAALGEVYLADDSTRNRQVLIKVLSTEIRRDANRLRRIKDDVDAAAKLSHPAIARVYGIEQGVDDTGLSIQFVSMDYVEGQFLSDRITSDGLSLSQIYSWFYTMSEALIEAHRRNIIHRDLNPRNLIITPKDEIIITGFGMARIIRPDLDLIDGNTPTRNTEVVRTLMQAGPVLDTIAYMSPEQAEGRVPTERSDIFSIGAILFEAITGRRAFQGPSYVDLISSILHDELEMATAHKPAIPYLLSRTAARCLQKDQRERYQSMEQVRQDIEEVRREVEPRKVIEEQFAFEAEAKAQRRINYSFPWPAQVGSAAVLIVMGMVLGWGLGIYRSPSIDATAGYPVRKLPISNMFYGMDSKNENTNTHTPIISPDGQKFVYVHKARLWLRNLVDMQPQILIGTDGGTQPFWSPYSNAIGYFKQNESTHEFSIHKYDLQSAINSEVCDLPESLMPDGATWRTSGEILYSLIEKPKDLGGLYAVSEFGGTPRLISTPDRDGLDTGYHFPTAIPDDQAFIYSNLANENTGQLIYEDEKTKKVLVNHPGEGVSKSVMTKDRFVVYQRGVGENQSLWGFHLSEKLEPSKPFPVAEHGKSPSVSEDGTLIYRVDTAAGVDRLVWIDRRGRIIGFIGQEQDRIDNPVISPDGYRVAVTGTERGNTDIWIHEGFQGKKVRLTVDPSYDFYPVWSPSGAQIAFSSVRIRSADIFLIPATGEGTTLSIVTGAKSEWVTSWSRDAGYLAYEVNDPSTNRDIWYIPMKGGRGNRRPTAFSQTPSQELYPQLSPDGKHIAYQSDESGKSEIYIRKFPSGRSKIKASLDRRTAPRWSPDGEDLFYVNNNTLMTLSLENMVGEAEFEPAKALFNAEEVGVRLLGEYLEPAYDVGKNGERFVAVQRHSNSTIMMVENWSEEYRREDP